MTEGHDIEQLIQRYAHLIINHGANLQYGQVFHIGSEFGKERLAQACATEAYKAGAKFVDVSVFDPYAKQARILHSPQEFLDYVPPWYGGRVLELGRIHGSWVKLVGSSAPGLLAGLDPDRLGKDQLPFIQEVSEVINAKAVNWTVSPGPNRGWAQVVYPDLDVETAYEKLWEEIAYICRLNEPDPKLAWEKRLNFLEAMAGKLTASRFDMLHFEGPGTDLRVGLFPTSRWVTAKASTSEGIHYQANLPSEEVFTAPDPERVDGYVVGTRPLELHGTVVEGIRVRFEQGRAVEVDADREGKVLRSYTERDSGAARLGEVALVDNEGRVGKTKTTFYETLLDENSASHIALGSAYRFTLGEEDYERMNESSIHLDFMIGSDEIAVTGVTHSGERVPILRDGAWQDW